MPSALLLSIVLDNAYFLCHLFRYQVLYLTMCIAKAELGFLGRVLSWHKSLP